MPSPLMTAILRKLPLLDLSRPEIRTASSPLGPVYRHSPCRYRRLRVRRTLRRVIRAALTGPARSCWAEVDAWQVEARLPNMPPCLIGMRACVGAHHLSYRLQSQGHDARLMPAMQKMPARQTTAEFPEKRWPRIRFGREALWPIRSFGSVVAKSAGDQPSVL